MTSTGEQTVISAARGRIFVAVLVLCLSLTGLGWWQLRQAEETAAGEDFSANVRHLTGQVQDLLLVYTDTLGGVAGLLEAAAPARETFRNYLAHLDWRRNLPALQAIAYAQVVNAAEVARHQDRIRLEGFPDYAIRPDGLRPQYIVNVFVEPFDAINRRGFGFDLLSDAKRREALERARDLNLLSMTGGLTLVVDRDGANTKAPGVLLFLPVYRPGAPIGGVDERRRGIQGFALAAFRVDDLLAPVRADALRSGLLYRVSDVTDTAVPDTLSEGAADDWAGPPRFSALTKLSAGGRIWQLEFREAPSAARYPAGRRSSLAGLAGILLSLMLSVLVEQMTMARQRTEERARELTADLAKSAAGERTALSRVEGYRAFLLRVIDQSPDAFAVKDLDSRLVLANQAYADLIGKPLPQVIGATTRELSPLAVAELVEAADRDAFASNRLAVAEISFLDERGRKRSHIVKKRRIEGPDDEPMLISVHSDITEVRASLARFQAIVGEAPMVAIAGLHLDGSVFLWNHAAEAMFGVSGGQLLGFGLDTVMGSEENRRRVREAIERVGADGSTEAIGKVSVVRPDGRKVWLEMTLFPVVDEGQAQEIFAMSLDVTERNRAEAELTEHRDHLRAKVAQRTLGLLHAKEAAERANLAKSEFLTNMSHELRTPLHAILSFANLGETRLEQLPAEKVRDYFERITAAGGRLLHLVDDLLDLSRLEAGRMSFSPETTDIRELAEDIVAELETLAGSKQLDVLVEPRASDHVAFVDRQRIGQVLRNLLGNAIKFTPDGGVIRLRLSDAQLPAGRRAGDQPRLQPAICIEVRDHGIGIPEGELESIFDKFVQSSSTRTFAGGTGLGLAISREIVIGHLGSIRARNNIDGGATFEVLLPLNETRIRGEQT